ncbi:DUF421 domain-containing protein [Ammoniphilus sp. CFH 90114]|uniref:DUF421 domain-containing protein n=1 Tax=Ammoniphilus sp. CFH 90114 TaxID=2493665 RepID=UPI00100FBE43|nr:YetF domain-containing protein [Ammoniphilus sp. CFH 90114]RXT05222.1 DUF421 domain-containing protein [Ammoniphilus sp. CFH 90114]
MFTVFWQSILLGMVGVLFLRIGGRKSIALMTPAQVAIMITIGSILGSEVAGKGLAQSILATGTFIAFLALVEWVSMKWNNAELVIKGKSIPVISEGKILVHNLKSLRLTVDDLEKRMRLVGLSSFKDIKSGTIEDNGEFGYELMPHAQPVTKGELEELLKANFPFAVIPPGASQESIFEEVIQDGHTQEIPKHLS